MRLHLGWAVFAAVAALTGCHDFSLGQGLPGDAVYDLKVEPLRVAPGGTLAITFGLRGGADVAVTVNGLPATQVEDGAAQRWTYKVAGDEGELLNVVATVSLGGKDEQFSAQAFLDAQPPDAPALEKLSLTQVPPGQVDRVAGLPGCVSGSDVRTVELALDAAARILIATATVAADGSFAAQDLGDNQVGRFYVFARDESGNRSAPTVAVNDIEGPQLLAADFSPRTPRAGLPVSAALRFDEALGATPTVSLVSGTASVALTVSSDPETGEWSARAEDLALPAGPASLRLDAVDALGNARHVEQLVAVGSAEGFTLDFVRLYRAGSAGWSVMGVAGAAPFPAQIEARFVHAGVEILCGSKQAASDGSFEAIPVAATLLAEDRVRLEAFDETGGRVGEATLVPDMVAPTGVVVAITPDLVGPAAPAVITVTASEVIGPETAVRVAGNDAVREGTGWSNTATFRYAVRGTEIHGEALVEVDVADLAGNRAPREVASVDLDMKAPQVSYGGGWKPEEDPSVPWTYAPPDTVEVNLVEPADPPPASGVVRVSWSATRLRDAWAWDGTKFAPSPVPFVRTASAQFSLDLKSMVAQDERVEILIEAEDGVGNVGTTRLALSRFAARGWTPIYPGPGKPLKPGAAVTGVRTAKGTICIALYACPTAAQCTDPFIAGRIGLHASQDGGRTWADKSPSPDIVVDNYVPDINALVFDASGEHGLLVGKSLVLLLDSTCTPVGQAIALPTTEEIYSAIWDGGVAWIATSTGLFRSDDLGLHWSGAGFGSAGGWFDMLAVAPGHLLAVGPSGAKTTSFDGGKSWLPGTMGATTNDVYSLVKTPDGILWAVGVQAILYSISDGLSWDKVKYDVPVGVTDWYGSLARSSNEGPWVRMRTWDGYEWEHLWERLGPDRFAYRVWTDGTGAEMYHEMMDVIPLDGWAAFGIGGINPGWNGEYQEWTTWTVSGGL